MYFFTIHCNPCLAYIFGATSKKLYPIASCGTSITFCWGNPLTWKNYLTDPKAKSVFTQSQLDSLSLTTPRQGRTRIFLVLWNLLLKASGLNGSKNKKVVVRPKVVPQKLPTQFASHFDKQQPKVILGNKTQSFLNTLYMPASFQYAGC